MGCTVCGVEVHDPALYRRGRSGRPYQRMVRELKRDGVHVCWICGVPIDMALHHNDKWSWTLDHVLPKHTYPCLSLDSTNHREAHRTCNSAKGVKGIVYPKRNSSRNSEQW